MVIWFLALGVMGLVNILENPNILFAINPIYAINFLNEHSLQAFIVLGAVFLVLTGAEALYADMGHFGRMPIRLGWYLIVLPGLVLNYFGQGALLLADPGYIDNPFFRLVPNWLAGAMVVFAAFATVIASQAVISGAFSVTQQAVHLGYLPRLRTIYTSDEERRHRRR